MIPEMLQNIGSDVFFVEPRQAFNAQLINSSASNGIDTGRAVLVLEEKLNKREKCRVSGCS